MNKKYIHLKERLLHDRKKKMNSKNRIHSIDIKKKKCVKTCRITTYFRHQPLVFLFNLDRILLNFQCITFLYSFYDF